MADSDITQYLRDEAAADGVKWNNERASRVFEGVIQRVFRAAILSGSFRLPAGFGSFAIRIHKATRRRINGELVDVPSQAYVRYVEGDAVRAALGKKDHYPERKRPPKPVL